MVKPAGFRLAFYAVTVFLVQYFFLGAMTAFGGEEVGGAFSVRPAKVELSLESGETRETTIMLSNDTALPIRVEISFEDVAPSLQGDATEEPFRLLGDSEGKFPSKRLFSTPHETLDILSGQSVDVPVRVLIPASAEPGGHYGGVVFSFRPVLPSQGGGNQEVAVLGRVATLFFIKVGDVVKEEGHVVAFGLFNNARVVAEPGETAPARFAIAFENTGDVHLNPHGTIAVSNMWRADRILVVDPWAVIPGATRMREMDLSESLLPGYHTATLSLASGYGDKIETRAVGFWVRPSFLALTLALLGFLLLALLVRRSLQLSRHFHA